MVSEDEALPVPQTARPEQVLQAALAHLNTGAPAMLATVLKRRGSAPSTPGQKLALLGEKAIGTIGGGAVERQVLLALKEARVQGTQQPWVEHYALGARIGMCCGGSVEILLEPLLPSLPVLLVGAGHIGSALAPLLDSLGFRVQLCDSREATVAQVKQQHPRLNIHCGDHDDPALLTTLSTTLGHDQSHAAMLVMTHDHQRDQQVIEWALKHGFGFVGGVGSRAKAARTRSRLEAKDFPTADVARVHMPVGDAIGARLPGEIAVAIAAQLIRWRAEHHGR